MSAAKSTDAHIIALTETKLGKITPNTPGYSWVNGPRDPKGGGVALLIRDDISHMINKPPDLEDQDQEIKWIELKCPNNNIFIGVYYGPQEKVSEEEVERQFSQITSQIIKLKKRGEIILTGDFNAKIEINNNVVKQAMSRNGKIMQNMIENTNMTPVSTQATMGNWTRVKRKDNNERSVIDYILMSEQLVPAVNYIEIDEAGSYRLKGKAESDHNTIIMEFKSNITKKTSKSTIFNTKNKNKWREFNSNLEKMYEENEPQTYTEFEEMMKISMEKSLDKITIKKGQYNPKLTLAAKRLKEEKRIARKEFEKAPGGPRKKKWTRI